MKGRIVFAVGVLAAVGIAAAALLKSPSAPDGVPASPGKWQRDAVVLISIDTTRADRLHCYGYPKKTSPRIDALAAEGIRYTMHHAPVPYTLPSHATMLTGTIPPYHGVHSNVRQRLGASNITLAEVLAKAGYNTGAFVSAYVMEADFGLSRGFDTYDGVVDLALSDNDVHNHTQRRGEETMQRALQWLEGNADRPFFLFVHLFDPHAPYAAPEAFDAMFPGDPYAAEIAYADYCVGLLIDRLQQMGVYDRTLIVVTSDHGEGLGDHGEMTHGFFTYESTLHVPLVIKPVGRAARAGAVVEHVTGLEDVAPTILGAMKVEAPSAMQGRNLAAKWGGKPGETHAVYFESLAPTLDGGNPLVGVVDDRWKFILTSRPELYDLAVDPGENDNLFESHPAEARRLREALKRILATHARADTGDSSLALDAAAIERLRSLGYVGGSVAASGLDLLSIDPEKRDPKDMAAITLPVYEAMGLLEQGELGQAEVIAAKLIETDEHLPAPYLLLGQIAEKREKTDLAVKYFETHLEKVERAIASSQTPRLKDDYIDGLAYLAAAHQKAGDMDAAVSRYEQLLAAASDHFLTHRELAKIYFRRGDEKRSIEHTKQLVNIRPDFAEAHYNLAVHLAERKQVAEAMEHYRAAIANDAKHFRAMKNLGLLEAQAGQMDAAIGHWRAAVELSPDDVALRHNLATALARGGQIEEAVTHWEAAVKRDRDFKPGWKSLSVAYKALGRADDAARAARMAH